MWKSILNLPLDEYMALTPGEMMDLISCYQISQGIAREKEQKDQQHILDLR